MISRKSSVYEYEPTFDLPNKRKNKKRKMQFLKVKDDNSLEFSLNMKFVAIINLVKEVSEELNEELYLKSRSNILSFLFDENKYNSYSVLYTQLFNDYYLERDEETNNIKLGGYGKDIIKQIKQDSYLNQILLDFNSKNRNRIKQYLEKNKLKLEAKKEKEKAEKLLAKKMEEQKLNKREQMRLEKEETLRKIKSSYSGGLSL